MANESASLVIKDKEAFGALVREYLIENPQIIIEVFDILDEQIQQEQTQADRGRVELHRDEINFDPHSWVGGNPEGDITIVEFVDYRCGYCRRAHPIMKELIQEDGNIRYVVKEFPILGEQSEASARLAIAVLQLAGSDAYQKVHDLLITLQGPVTENTFEQIAQLADVLLSELEEKVLDPRIVDVIRENYRLASMLEIDSTPTFIIDGVIYRGLMSKEDILEIVTEGRT